MQFRHLGGFTQTVAATLIGVLIATAPAFAQGYVFPKTFRTQEIAVNGTTIHVRVAGSGPAVVLLHGYGETGDMWAPLAADLARDHTVIVPDLRGMGLSAPVTSGFEKKNQALDVAGVMDALHAGKADVVAHDIGNMVAFAFASRYPDRVNRLVLMDAPVPGVGPWDEVLKNPLLWHFRFGGADMERLVAGRERVYLDRFWNEFSADPAKFDEASRAHYAKFYQRPGAMKAGFAQFAAFDQDAIDNRAYLAAGGKLHMPVLAIGGDASFGSQMADVMRAGADNVQEKVVPASGHWLMEENPKATVAAIRSFLDSDAVTTKPGAKGELRLTAVEIDQLARGGAGAGTSGMPGIQTTILSGDPSRPGPYALEIRVPPNTRIESHTHRDGRTAMVVSGKWFFAYGENAAAADVKLLTVGGFYTEPQGLPHYALTRDEPAVVLITGVGPTDTVYRATPSKPK